MLVILLNIIFDRSMQTSEKADNTDNEESKEEDTDGEENPDGKCVIFYQKMCL